MKITLDQATLAKAVITHLRSVGVQSDITTVEFRYTRVPYTVFAEVELAEASAGRPPKAATSVEPTSAPADEEASPQVSLVDPDNLPDLPTEPPDEPRPDTPAAPLFGGG